MSATNPRGPTLLPNDLGRRSFLGVLAGAAAGACSGGTDGSPPEPEPGAQRTGSPESLQESPMLAERVEAGELPPVAERLPKEPYVVRPGSLVSEEFVGLQPGTYGGTLELPTPGAGLGIGMHEPLLWSPNGFDHEKGIEGSVFAGWEVNDDSTVFTFHMREGLRWSDGEPVTTDDVRFTFEDVHQNEEITPVFPPYLRAGADPREAPAQLEVIDEFTFSLTFGRPYGTFPIQLAIGGWRRYTDIIKPRHHLEQFHQDYASESDLAALMAEESIPEGEWYNLFNAKQFTGAFNDQNMDHPALTPWVMTRSTSEVFSHERNPYYFKVDVEGNQLPYIDEMRGHLVQDKETMMSRALFGEFDYLGERGSLRELSLIAEKAEAGEVKILVPRMHRLPVAFGFNLTHSDQVWREVTRNLEFRRALSLAINREEIIETFYLGEFARLPEETNPPDHDPDEANRILDGIGLGERDGDGFRLGPDGNRFVVPFEVPDVAEDYIPMTELIAEFWKDVDVSTTVKQISPELHGERLGANELKATINWAHHDIWPATGWDDRPGERFSPLWKEWFLSNGDNGEEPPDEIKELYDLYDTFMAAPIGSPEGEAAMDAFIQSYRDNIWIFAPVEHSYYPTFFKTRVKNVPEGVKQEVFGIIVMYSMEQWYMEENG